MVAKIHVSQYTHLSQLGLLSFVTHDVGGGVTPCVVTLSTVVGLIAPVDDSGLVLLHTRTSKKLVHLVHVPLHYHT